MLVVLAGASSVSDGNETGVEPIGESGSENEAARFDARNHVNGVADVVLTEAVNQHVKAKLIFQQGGEGRKKECPLRVVRHFADQLLQIVHSNVSPSDNFSCKSRSSVGIDDESALVLRIRCGGLFVNRADVGETRAALQHGSKFRVLLRGTHGEYFHATVAKVSNEAADTQFFRGSLGEITKSPRPGPFRTRNTVWLI